MKPRVLIIDDEVTICSVLGSYLEENGFAIKTANNLQGARVALNEGEALDAIILDVMLPDGNGIIFLRELRLSQKTKMVPVIVMSAMRNKSEDRVAGFEMGADDYVSKPF